MPWIDLSILEWILVMLCAMLVGISKSGVAGAGIVVIPVLAGIFGGRPSTGFLLPMLVMADIMAVWYYNRHAQWSYLLRLFPWTVAGIGIGLWVGDVVDDRAFKQLIGVIIFVCLALMVWQDIKKKRISVPDTWWFSGMTGLAGGFATMIGNAAGPLMAVYLLSIHLPKNHYIGTAAWFFLLINVFKLPLHYFIWETIMPSTLLANVAMLPMIAVGAGAGIWVVQKFPERAYRIFIIVTTGISSLIMLF